VFGNVVDVCKAITIHLVKLFSNQRKLTVVNVSVVKEKMYQDTEGGISERNSPRFKWTVFVLPSGTSTFGA